MVRLTSILNVLSGCYQLSLIDKKVAREGVPYHYCSLFFEILKGNPVSGAGTCEQGYSH
jgi:hypothetical protein